MSSPQQLRQKLCDLQNWVLNVILRARNRSCIEEMSGIVHQTTADTIYQIDRISEEAIQSWFIEHWPEAEPVQIIMEGIEDDEVVLFPLGTPLEKARWKCLIDPIDGTRNLMFDKRSAWILTGLAPHRGEATQLSEIVVAAMTEIPTTKSWRSDQISAVRGEGLVAEAVNLFSGERKPFKPQPSKATSFGHGFASTVHFFPDAKNLLTEFESALWQAIYADQASLPPIFDDQLLSTAGQLYELMVGHDRMNGDLRPLAFAKLGLRSHLTCHPYDICIALLLQEAGGVVEKPDGSPLDAPFTTTAPISFMAYANANLAAKVRPLLPALIEKYFGR